MKIYVASSWRNSRYPYIVEALRDQGYDVYDFKNPEPGNYGFNWSEVDPFWKNWSPDEFRKALNNPIAAGSFDRDMAALRECDVCVLVMPCGRSAHLEAGFAMGANKITIILLSDGEPELMYKMTPFVCVNMGELLNVLSLYTRMLDVKAV